MQVSKLEDQIIQILEEKYKHTIDKDDPVMLSITAQVLVTEHLLEIHKNNLEAEFENFKEDISNILKSSKADSDENKKIISEHIRKTFLNICDDYKGRLDAEFLKAGQGYQKTLKWYKLTKLWAIGAIGASGIIGLVLIFLHFN